MDPSQVAEQAPPLIAHNAPLSDKEVAEFAAALGVRPEAIRSYYADAEPEPSPDDYERLVADPLKSRFAPRQEFFAEIKRDIVHEVARRYFPTLPARSLRILDVGCGSGALMRPLARDFDYVAGCDPSASMVARAGESAKLMPAPTELPYDDATFDIVVCACVYHHIDPELRPAHLRAVRRVLRAGGRLLIFEHNPRTPLTRRIVRRCPLDENAQLLPWPETRDLLGAAGFEQVTSRFYLFLPQSWYARCGWLERYLHLTGLGGQYCAIGGNPRTLRTASADLPAKRPPDTRDPHARPPIR